MDTLSQLSLVSLATVVVERQSEVDVINANELDRRCADSMKELPSFPANTDDDIVSEQSVKEMQPTVSAHKLDDIEREEISIR